MEVRRLDVDSLELVYDVLKEVELEEYFPKIRDDLNLTRLSHFEHVKVQDLAQIGLGRPAGRRLLSAVRQRRAKLEPNLLHGFLDLLNPKFCGNRRSSRDSGREEPLYSNVKREGAVSCLITSKNIVLKEKLGQGSFGEVMKAEWSKEDGRTVDVAVKMLRSDALALPGAFGDFVKEVNAMIGLNHPNLIKLYGVSLSSPYMIVQELAALGSVLDRLRKECSLTSVAVLLEWAKQICAGMAYLESQRWIHRDLAARNVLLSAVNKVKIGDFGLMKSIEVDEDCYVMSEHKKIPFPWCAPECLKLRKFSHASDCWAYGVTLWEIFTFGQHPWAGNTGAQILQLIDQEGKRLAKPEACPPEIYSIMLQCWSHRDQDRPTFAALTEVFRTRHLEVLRATRSFDEPGRLQLNQGDQISVIDGQLENHWWMGQNKRTLFIGTFPRSIAKDVSVKKTSHISNPLRNSFIHTGHGDTDPKKSFGNPSAIDDIYLRNPVPAPDLLGHPTSRDQPALASSPASFQLDKPPNSVKTRTAGPVDSADVLLNLIDEIPATTNPLNSYGNDFTQADVDYFNVPPGGQAQADPWSPMPSAPEYHYFSPPTHPPVHSLPDKPVSYGNVFQGPDPGMLYSNVVMPTVSPNYSPNTYYNTASFVVRPAPPIPVAVPKPTVVPAQATIPAPAKYTGKVGKNEKVIKTYPVSLSIDPFDTTAVSSDLWSGFREKLPSKGRADLYRDESNRQESTGEPLFLPTDVADRLLGTFAEERSKSTEVATAGHRQNATQPASSPGWTGLLPITSAVINSRPSAADAKIPVTPVLFVPQTAISKSPVTVRPIHDDSGNSTGSGGSDDTRRAPTGTGMSSVLDDLLDAVQALFPGETATACEDALRASHFDQQKAVRLLKVKMLLRLAVAGEEECRRVLDNCAWDVEKAGAALLGLA